MDYRDVVMNDLTEEQVAYYLIYLQSLLAETSEQRPSDQD
jgi:hypothetical protein